MASSLTPPSSEYDKSKIVVQEVPIDGKARHLLIENGTHVASKQHSSLLGIRLIKGKSVAEVSNLLSRDEIDYLVESSVKAAADQTINNVSNEQQGPGRKCIRMPTQPAASRNDVPDAGSEFLHDPLPLDVSRFVEERILQRTLAYVDEELPDIRETLFGGDCKSLVGLFVDGEQQLTWSTREPAMNVYYPPEGYFGIHKDNQALTILMPLTSPDDDFTGGGTAFWSQSHPNETRHAPSLILAPKAGTALLFGGKVSHKGLAIETGMRIVFVASFSRKSNKSAKTWTVSAR